MNEDHGHKEVPTGEWVDVEKGYIVAPGTYIDEKGVLREESSGSCVVWHNPGCERRGITSDQIKYDPATKAPWCDKCFMSNEIEKKFSKLFGMKIKVKWCGEEFPRFHASSAGHVWRDGILIPGNKNKRGHLVTSSNRKEVLFHHLVLTAFEGKRPKGLNGLHRNDIGADNRIENLYWGTQSDNMYDCVRNGGREYDSGESNSSAKLTEDQVREIRKLYIPGKNGNSKKLSVKFGVSVSTITRVAGYKLWREIR